MCRCLLLTLLLACIAPALSAQETSDEDAYTSLSKGMRAQPDLLARYDFLQVQKRKTDDAEIHNYIDQMLATDLAEMANYRQAESIYGPISRREQNALPSGTAAPALEAILEMSRDERVVMLNEAHTVPRTRLLTFMLLKPMREAGFTHLALEALSVDEHSQLLDDALPERGYPVEKTGYYTREPIFGEIIREAIRLGYTLVAYEYGGSEPGQQARETGQAKTLADVIQHNPGARLFVHAGHGHINEDSSNFIEGARTMADEFKRMTGIDPLTIEQTRLWDQPDASRNHPAYVEGLKLWHTQHAGRDPTAPFLIMTSRQAAWSLRPSSYDISVFTAPWTDDQHWRELDGLRPRRNIANNPCATYPCLIEARYAAESDDAVPADRQLLDNPGPVQLWLRDGCYRLSHLPKDTDANGKPQPVCFPHEAGAGSAIPSR